MIVASQKPIDEIVTSLGTCKKIALAACGTCVTVCLSGGESEALKLKELLLMRTAQSGNPAEITVFTPKRQCDREFIEEIEEQIKTYECVLSLACGAGVQFMSDIFPEKQVLPAQNTSFLGVSTATGEWDERCQGCGNCMLERTGGICPIARCSKSNQNGPCGGSQNGKCEVDEKIECGWQLIYDRLKAQNKVSKLTETVAPRDWRTARDGGPRKLKNEEILI